MSLLLGDRLKAFMLSNNQSIEDVSKKSGLDINTIKNIVYNKSKKKEHVETIANAYGLPIAYFSNPDSHLKSIKILNELTFLLSKEFIEKGISNCYLDFFFSLLSNVIDLSEKGLTEAELKLYIKGNIDAAIKFNILKPN